MTEHNRILALLDIRIRFFTGADTIYEIVLMLFIALSAVFRMDQFTI